MIGLAMVAAFALGGCSSAQHAASSHSPDASRTASVRPIPTGCPSAHDLAASLPGTGSYAAVDPSLLDNEVETPLPSGGCAYINSFVHKSSNSSSTSRDVSVFYFNLGKPGKQTRATLTAWAKTAGATGKDPDQLNLPNTFAPYEDATISLGGTKDGLSFGFKKNGPAAAWTHGQQAAIDFNVSSSAAKVLTSAGLTPTIALGPTHALEEGLSTQFSASIPATSDAGYTVIVHVKGTMQPAELTNSANEPPGQVLASFWYNVGASVTNTTPGKNAPTPLVSVFAVYPESDEVCSLDSGSAIGNGYCRIELGNFATPTISAGTTSALEQGTNAGERSTIGPLAENGAGIAQVNEPASIYAQMEVGEGTGVTNWTSTKGCNPDGNLVMIHMDGWPDVLCS
jgi:hypothetical protein